ncbi:thermonuclease family protein [Sagittula sp. SSi028]|uniref:thermonuclease family protein n=1 Tax=Sagittula sp. SSi028 TaxID=3400636 RepID=UPI003AF6D9C2
MTFIVCAAFGVVILRVLLAKKPKARNAPGRQPWPDRPSKPARSEATSVAPPEPFAPDQARAPDHPETLCGPAYVVDGDTIRVQKTQIRLFGIDAPELDHPFGKKSKWEMVRLCKGQRIRAEILERDHFGRVVAKCYLPDGRDLSAELVRAGLAIDWPKFSGGCYSDLEHADARKRMWLAAARQKGHMGLWDKYEKRARAPAEDQSS